MNLCYPVRGSLPQVPVEATGRARTIALGLPGVPALRPQLPRVQPQLTGVPRDADEPEVVATFVVPDDELPMATQPPQMMQAPPEPATDTLAPPQQAPVAAPPTEESLALQSAPTGGSTLTHATTTTTAPSGDLGRMTMGQAFLDRINMGSRQWLALTEPQKRALLMRSSQGLGPWQQVFGDVDRFAMANPVYGSTRGMVTGFATRPSGVTLYTAGVGEPVPAHVDIFGVGVGESPRAPSPLGSVAGRTGYVADGRYRAPAQASIGQQFLDRVGMSARAWLALSEPQKRQLLTSYSTGLGQWQVVFGETDRFAAANPSYGAGRGLVGGGFRPSGDVSGAPPRGMDALLWGNMSPASRESWLRANGQFNPPADPAQRATWRANYGLAPEGGAATTAMPGGVTAAQWASMSEAERTEYIRANAQTQQQLQLLIAAGITSGINGIVASIQAAQNTEIARIQDAGQRRAAIESARIALETARINAQRDIRMAEIAAQRNGTTVASEIQTTSQGLTGTGGSLTQPSWFSTLTTGEKLGLGAAGAALVGGGVFLATRGNKKRGGGKKNGG